MHDHNGYNGMATMATMATWPPGLQCITYLVKLEKQEKLSTSHTLFAKTALKLFRIKWLAQEQKNLDFLWYDVSHEILSVAVISLWLKYMVLPTEQNTIWNNQTCIEI